MPLSSRDREGGDEDTSWVMSLVSLVLTAAFG